MSLSMENVLEHVTKVDAVQKLKVSISSSLKYGAIVGASTCIGGLLGGPIGLVVGGTVSSLISSYYASNEFESVPYIIYHRMTQKEREKIAQELMKLITNKNIVTLYDLITSLNNNSMFVEQIIQFFIRYLASQCKMNVLQN